MTTLSDKNILELWKSPLFSGSFTGVKNFQTILKLEKNIDISEKHLRNILEKEPIFLYHQRKHSNFKRRQYDLNNYGELVQCDLAYMYPYNGFKFILVVIDCFSSKVFAKALKNKSGRVVAEALKELLQKFKTQIYVLESDRGKEFISKEAKQVYRDLNIYYKFKIGKNKAAFVEREIYILKRKLYMLLRSKLSENWLKYLPQIVSNLNNTPMKKLGFLKPIDITSEKSTVEVNVARNTNSIDISKQPNIFKQLETEENDRKSKKSLKVGDFVYKQFDTKMFDKKYNISVRTCNFDL